MSNKEILDLNSKIYGQYLPSAPAPHPYVENPMADDLDANAFNIINIGSVIFDTNNKITASLTNPNELELVATGGSTVVVSDTSKTGQVNDFVFNNALDVKQITAPFPYNGGVVYHGQITRVFCNTGGSTGELVLEEQYNEKLNNMFGIIADPTNTDAFDINYSNGPSSTAPLSFTTADNGKLIWCIRLSPTSVIRLG
jgi:hypothetical protein